MTGGGSGDSTRKGLDVFSGAGGCSMGYSRAGFAMTGVDNRPMPRYPFEFIQGDALEVLADLDFVRQFDFVHASPPCQAHTSLNVMWNARQHQDLVGPTRELLDATGLPYVIENVEGAPLLNPVRICGTSLGLGAGVLKLRRHRLFETNWTLMAPPCAHGRGATLGIYGDHARGRRRSKSIENGQFRAAEGLELARTALEMPWANWRELSQAIPPAYTELIGHQLAQHLAVRAAA